jgi:hypothetical protein
MRRAVTGLAATAFTVLALAGSASAASGQVTQFKFHGMFADALWVTNSAASITDTSINVSKSNQGSELLADQFTINLDANGNFTGGTDIFAEVTSGFSFTIGQALASASTSGPGLPATACTFDANFHTIGCSPTTIDVTANWTGQGPTTRDVHNEHFKSPGLSENVHFNGTDRAATATGSIGGLTLNASELAFADLGTTKSGTITLCMGGPC